TSFAFVPSLNIVKQNGHALEIIVGSTSNACSVLATLIRFPVSSSDHMSPPPAPQHIPFSFVRTISTNSSPGMAFKISLGGSYTLLSRPRYQESWYVRLCSIRPLVCNFPCNTRSYITCV